MHSAQLCVTATLCHIYLASINRESYFYEPNQKRSLAQLTAHSLILFRLESMLTAGYCFPYMKQGRNLSLFLQCHDGYFKERRSHANQTHHN